MPAEFSLFPGRDGRSEFRAQGATWRGGFCPAHGTIAARGFGRPGDWCALVELLCQVSWDKMAGCAEDCSLGEGGTITHHH